MDVSEEAVEKIEKIERHTGRFSGMQVLTIVVVIGGIILGYADRDKATTIDNSKQLNDISLNLAGIKDSVKMLKMEITGRMDINHLENLNRLKTIKDKQNEFDYRLKILERQKNIIGYTEKKKPNGMITYNPVY
jgi:hypothetical protein